MNLDEFRVRFRPVAGNRFRVFAEIPLFNGSFSQLSTNPYESRKLEVYIKSIQIPGSTIGTVPINYRGREIKFPAERVFQEISMNIYCSSELGIQLRSELMSWMDRINSPDHTAMDYFPTSKWEIYYDTEDGNTFGKRVVLSNCYPIEMTPIELNNDIPDSIADFVLTLAYDYAEEFAI
jgi:hypothetical protein